MIMDVLNTYVSVRESMFTIKFILNSLLLFLHPSDLSGGYDVFPAAELCSRVPCYQWDIHRPGLAVPPQLS